MEITSIKLGGLKSDCCVTKLTEALTATAGVEKVSISLEHQQANINFNPEQINRDGLKEAVAAAGYEVLPAHGEEGNCCGSCS